MAFNFVDIVKMLSLVFRLEFLVGPYPDYRWFDAKFGQQASPRLLAISSLETAWRLVSFVSRPTLLFGSTEVLG
jgi:hypothetical protein